MVDQQSGRRQGKNRLFLAQQDGRGADGNLVGPGDAAAQADQAMDNVRSRLAAAGAAMGHVRKLTTYVTDRAHWEAVQGAIGRHTEGFEPCATGLVVSGLPQPEMLVAIDVDAVIPEDGGGGEIFLPGLAGAGSEPALTPEDSATQTANAMNAVQTALENAGAGLEDICKIKVYVSDRAYREAVYGVIGRHLRGVYPVSTGLIVRGFANPRTVMAIDVMAMHPGETSPERLHKFKTADLYAGRQNLSCEFCMVVRAGDRVFMRGQISQDHGKRFVAHGDPAGQADQALDNIFSLLTDAGGGPEHIRKVFAYVTDRAHMDPVNRVLARRLAGLSVATSLLIVRGLGIPEAQVEIDVDAVVT